MAADPRRPRPVLPLLTAAGLAAFASATPPARGAAPDPAAVQEQAEACMACHAPAAEPPDAPHLHGQPAFFLMAQLVQFREGRRGADTPMAEIAKELGDAEIRALSRHFAGLPAPVPPEGATPDPARQARGAELAKEHRCGTCHLPSYAGAQQVPRLAAQKEEYLLNAMGGYKSGARIGTGAAMPEVMSGVSEEGAADIAHYLAHLGR
jgi:cytochrome c553